MPRDGDVLHQATLRNGERRHTVVERAGGVRIPFGSSGAGAESRGNEPLMIQLFHRIIDLWRVHPALFLSVRERTQSNRHTAIGSNACGLQGGPPVAHLDGAATARLQSGFSRKVDGKDATRWGYIAEAEDPVIRFDAALTDGEPESQPGLVHAGLCKWHEHSIGAVRRQATAMILDFDQNTIRDGIGGQGDLRPRPREFEGVLQQVADCRGQHVTVDIDRKTFLDVRYGEPAAPGTGLEQRRDPDLLNEIGDGNQFVAWLHSSGHTDIRE